MLEAQAQRNATLLLKKNFESKVKTIIESHFAKEVVESSDDTILENNDADETVELSSSMESYVSAIKKISPKK